MALKVGQQLRLLHDGKKYFVVHEPINLNNPNNGKGTAPTTNAIHSASTDGGRSVHRNANIDTDIGDLD